MSISKLTGSGVETGADAYPLTTIWTAPAGCPSIVSFQSVSALYTTADEHCAPPDYDNVWYLLGYYSPGVCFSGYTIGCTGKGILNSATIKATETAAVCVPIGYTCVPHYYHTSWTIHAGISVQTTASPFYWDYESLVPAFQIRWASSDLSVLPSSPSWSIVTTSNGLPIPATQSPAVPSSTTRLPSTTPTSIPGQTPSQGLSAGAIAGIVVPIVLALLLGALGLFIFLRRRRRGEVLDHDQPESTSGHAELQANQSWDDHQLRKPRHEATELDSAALAKKRAAELDSAAISEKRAAELDSTALPKKGTTELDSTTLPENKPSELPGDEDNVVELGAHREAAAAIPELQGSQTPVTSELPSPGSPILTEKEAVSTISPHSGPSASEKAATELMKRQLELEERKQRLLQLQKIDDEHNAIRERLAQLRNKGGQ